MSKMMYMDTQYAGVTPEKDFSDLIDFFYPVGCYFETSDENFNPNSEWSGAWVQETAGQVHVSAGTGYSVSGALTNTSDGGSKYIQQHGHGFTNPTISLASGGGIGGNGTHSHAISNGLHYVDRTSGYVVNNSRATVQNQTSGAAFYNTQNFPTNDAGWHGHDFTNPTYSASGGSVGNVSGVTAGQGNNMPPYINVYRWHRIA